MRAFQASALRPFPFASRPLARRRQVVFQRYALRHATSAAGPKVSVSRPWFTKGRMMSFMAYTIISYVTLRYTLGKIFTVDVQMGEDDKDTQKKEEGERAEQEGGSDLVTVDEDSVAFVALQYPKKLPEVQYKASDPEWQEFVKLSKDKPRQAALRDELANKVLKAAAGIQAVHVKLGKDIKWSRHWLDFIYPQERSPEYIRQGLFVDEESMGVALQKIPHSEYQELRSILYPKVVITALKDSVSAFCKLLKIRVKDMLGVTLAQDEKRLQMKRQLIVMRWQAQQQDEESSQAQERVQDHKAEKLGPREGLADGSKELGALGGVLSLREAATEQIRASLPYVQDLVIGVNVFKSSLVANWPASRRDRMPKGCCYLWGHIELKGAKGRCKMAVVAAYEPKADKFSWVDSKVVRTWTQPQLPQGGT